MNSLGTRFFVATLAAFVLAIIGTGGIALTTFSTSDPSQTATAPQAENQPAPASTPTADPAAKAPTTCAQFAASATPNRWIFVTANPLTGTAPLTVGSTSSTPTPTSTATPTPTDTATPVPTQTATAVAPTGSLQYSISIRRGQYFASLGANCAPKGQQYVVVLYSGTPTASLSDGYGYTYKLTGDSGSTSYELTAGSQSFKSTQVLGAANGSTAVVFVTPKADSVFSFTGSLGYAATRDTSNDAAVRADDPNYAGVPSNFYATFSVTTPTSLSVTTSGESCDENGLSGSGAGDICNPNFDGAF